MSVVAVVEFFFYFASEFIQHYIQLRRMRNLQIPKIRIVREKLQRN